MYRRRLWLVGIFATACGYSGPVPPDRISVNPATPNIAVGETVQLTVHWSAIGMPGELSWYTSNRGVASVSATGLVTGIAPGMANISALGTRQGQSPLHAIAIVTVRSGTMEPAPTLRIDPPSSAVPMLGTTRFVAQLRSADGGSEDVSRRVQWTSSDPRIATINAEGVATGVASGAAVIQANLEGMQHSAMLTVLPREGCVFALHPAETSMRRSSNVVPVLSARYDCNNGTNLEVDGSTLVWMSSDTSIVTVTGSSLGGDLSPGTRTGVAIITARQGTTTSSPTTVTVEP